VDELEITRLIGRRYALRQQWNAEFVASLSKKPPAVELVELTGKWVKKLKSERPNLKMLSPSSQAKEMERLQKSAEKLALSEVKFSNRHKVGASRLEETGIDRVPDWMRKAKVEKWETAAWPLELTPKAVLAWLLYLHNLEQHAPRSLLNTGSRLNARLADSQTLANALTTKIHETKRSNVSLDSKTCLFILRRFLKLRKLVSETEVFRYRERVKEKSRSYQNKVGVGRKRLNQNRTFASEDKSETLANDLKAEPEAVRLSIQILKAQRGEGILGKWIVTQLKKAGIKIETTTFYRHIAPKLKKYGVKNLPSRGGYYIQES
jgi:hypothetical protein